MTHHFAVTALLHHQHAHVNNFIKKGPKQPRLTHHLTHSMTGQRPSTGIFIYTKPKDQIQKNHNKQALALLETKKSQLTIEQQAIGSAFKFKLFIKSDFTAPIDITENLCKRFQQYLLDKYTGKRR